MLLGKVTSLWGPVLSCTLLGLITGKVYMVGFGRYCQMVLPLWLHQLTLLLAGGRVPVHLLASAIIFILGILSRVRNAISITNAFFIFLFPYAKGIQLFQLAHPGTGRMEGGRETSLDGGHQRPNHRKRLS